MVNSFNLALMLSIIAVTLAFVAIVMVIDVRARVQTYESIRRGEMERKIPENNTRSFSGDGTGVAGSIATSDKSISSGFHPIPEVTPTAIAPGLKTPPRPKGGFGSRTKNASQLSQDN